MTEEVLGTSTVSRSGRHNRQVHLPSDVNEALGEPDELVWFAHPELSLVYVEPRREVDLG